MKTVRCVLSVAMFLLGALLGLMAMSKVDNDYLVSSTVANNHVIHAHLVETASFVRDFLSAHHRLPNEEDAERWKREAPGAGMRGATWWSRGPFEQEVLERFGYPPQSETIPFVVTYWRGEWREYYASWKDSTSLTFDPNSYYLFGSRPADIAIHSFLAVLAIVFAYLAWPVTAQPPSSHRNDA